MKIIYIYFLFLFVVMTSCTETEIDKVELQVKVKGKINLYSQFGEQIKDYDGVSITFTDTYKEYSPKIDSVGNYESEDLVTGTYNIFITGSGFVTRKIEGTQFLGGDIWQLNNFDLVQPSTAKISELEILNENGMLYLKGIITNNQKPILGNTYYQGIIFYLSDSPDISPLNYNHAFLTGVVINENYEFKIRVYPYLKEKLYCIACGCPATYNYYGGNGTPSNVATYINE